MAQAVILSTYILSYPVLQGAKKTKCLWMVMPEYIRCLDIRLADLYRISIIDPKVIVSLLLWIN